MQLEINIWIERLSLIIDLLGVVAIAFGTVYALTMLVIRRLGDGSYQQRYQLFKVRMGRGLLIGLEILLAADIIKTVALEPTFNNLGALGLLVLIRTFLGWSLLVEIEGRWPWQGHAEEKNA